MDYTLYLQPQFAELIKPKQNRIKSIKNEKVENGNTVPKDNFQARGGREIQRELSTIVNPEDNKQSFSIQSS